MEPKTHHLLRSDRPASSHDVDEMSAALPPEEVVFCRRFGGLALVLMIPVAVFVLFIAVGFAANIVHVIQGRPSQPVPASSPRPVSARFPQPVSPPPDTQPGS
jgi:hypothetical protein